MVLRKNTPAFLMCALEHFWALSSALLLEEDFYFTTSSTKRWKNITKHTFNVWELCGRVFSNQAQVESLFWSLPFPVNSFCIVALHHVLLPWWSASSPQTQNQWNCSETVGTHYSFLSSAAMSDILSRKQKSVPAS